jgi:hypothetical protein
MTSLNMNAGSPRPAKERGSLPRRCPHNLPGLFALAIALLLGACAVVPITPQTISGKYEIEGQPEGMWNGGEAIVLGAGTFEYSLFTADLVDNPHSMHYPTRGRYKLDGATITFLNSSVPYPQRTLTRRHKLFVLWTPKQIEDYHESGRKPDDLLYQHP